MKRKLSHIGRDGSARMVDVGAKAATRRVALAGAEVRMKPSTHAEIRRGRGAKGNVLEVARIAGIGAAKQTSTLIPLCHPLSLTKIGIEYQHGPQGTLCVTMRVETKARTAVEMEALTAVSIYALTW